MEGAGGSGEPSRSAREQRQGAAIARQLARGLRLGTTLFTQQEPRRATSVQNSPSTPLLTACAVQNSPSTSCTAPLPVQNSPRTPTLTACPGQNSPSTPEMAQFGAIYACRESFVPLSPPRSRAGRILYRTRGRVGASHDTTTGTTSAEGTGATTGPRCSTRGRRQGQHGLAGPAWVGRATSSQISHAIPPGTIQRKLKNRRISTIRFQYSKYSQGNCMRNY